MTMQEKINRIKAHATRTPTEAQRNWANWTISDREFLLRLCEIYGAPSNVISERAS